VFITDASIPHLDAPPGSVSDQFEGTGKLTAVTEQHAKHENPDGCLLLARIPN